MSRIPKDTQDRPEISEIETGEELRRWYWLKTELASEAKRIGMKSTGGKFDILGRLCHYKDTGSLKWQGDYRPAKSSAFDWHSSVLSMDTIITDNYKNTQNVRQFFKEHLGEHFKFNVELLDWFKDNVGKTLGDAARFWTHQQENPGQTNIKPHNQFNQYIRDFLKDNPTLGMKEAREVWAIKKALPSDTGRHVYEANDIVLWKNTKK